MGKKGEKKHLKRKPAPKFWPIHRKEKIWTVKPNPGPHPISNCIPLLLLIREILGFAKTRKEARTIISQEKIMVDGKTRREELFPVGLMDVVAIPDIKKIYRVLTSEKGLVLHPIEKKEAKIKLCRIENKNFVNGGQLQLNLHDGKNVMIQVKDPAKPEEDTYKTLDTLKINIPTQEIAGHIKLAKGAQVMIIGGKNVGKHGKIVTIEEKTNQKRRNSLVTVEDADGEHFQTIMNLIFVIGDAEPAISLTKETS